MQSEVPKERCTFNNTIESNNTNECSNSGNESSNSANESSNITNECSNSTKESSNRINKCSNSANKSSNSTNECSNSANESSNSTNECSNSTNECSNSTNECSNSTNESSNSANESSNSMNECSNSTNECSNRTNESSNSTNESSKSTHESSNSSNRSSNSANKSSNSANETCTHITEGKEPSHEKSNSGSFSSFEAANKFNNERKEEEEKSDTAASEHGDGDDRSSELEGETDMGRKCNDNNRTWKLHDVTSWDRLVRFLCSPTDPALLGFVRFLYGLLMLLDTMLERGMSSADYVWGDKDACRYPFFNGLKPLPLEWMYVLYLLMLFCTAGIMLGLFYRLSCIIYLCCYWYIFLLDKTSWNNHSYLFGLLSILFTLSDANRYWSLDALLNKRIKNGHVPLWNYILFRAQFFLVYFIAGLKKLDVDWLTGYSMIGLSHAWVFFPFRFFLTHDQITLFVVHGGGLFIDLFSGFLLVHPSTRRYGFYITSLFHIMNSQLFNIGMFPYGMLCMQMVFCEADFPRRLFKRVPRLLRLFTPDSSETDCVPNNHCVYSKEEIPDDSVSCERQMRPTSPNKRHQMFTGIAFAFIAWQSFLPFSHCITKGNNHWTNGLYGYSWDMMVHAWGHHHTRITYKNRDTNTTGYLNPRFWSDDRRWTHKPDMIKQQANCVADRLKAYNITNVELYFDLWSGINKRFKQRAIDPRVDVLRAEWGTFDQTPWMLPLLRNLSHWRLHKKNLTMAALENNPMATVLFLVDFPGLFIENYVQPDMRQTNLSVLAGKVIVERRGVTHNYTLEAGQTLQVPAGTYHKVHTISSTPSVYFYVYCNTTEYDLMRKVDEYEADMERAKSAFDLESSDNTTLEKYKNDPNLPRYLEIIRQEEKWKRMFSVSIFRRIMPFLLHKVYNLKRSFVISAGAVYCLVTNSSFEDFLNATHQWEERQMQEAVVAHTIADAVAATADAATAAATAAAASATAAAAVSTAAAAAVAASEAAAVAKSVVLAAADALADVSNDTNNK